ncbi:unnamed protein product [Heligmosomoides polygyrus]|uniref:START domain-containing protein n=1 Tax=Heligmosomoides polygyrus TaxID=6339 RepID=A0A183GKB1_HELPZ|nr:unnamed protein product [Heligmosomoides polygyrus]
MPSDDSNSERTGSPTKRELSSAMARKMSEPVMTSDGRQREDDTDVLPTTVRRANSSLEASYRPTENGMLSQTSLDQARQSTHKSYPSKMSSAEEFHTDGLKARAAKKDDVIGSLRDVVVPNIKDTSSSLSAKSVELANDAEFGATEVKNILHSAEFSAKLGKWVPHDLTLSQRKKCVDAAKELLDHHKQEPFLH